MEAMRKDETRARLRAGMLGLLVGDAFGVPYEFRRAAEIPDPPAWTGHGTHDQPPGTYSDDGALALCLLASLVERGGPDLDDVGRRSADWLASGHMAPGRVVFDVGHTTSVALRAIRAGHPAGTAGPAGDRDCGNGSLMRILPVGLVAPHLGWDDADLVDAALAASSVTHGHPRARVACALYALMAARAAPGADIEALVHTTAADLDALLALRHPAERAALTELLGAPQRLRPTGSGFVFDTFWGAVHALAGSYDYRGCVQRAVSLGRDTDTTACVAGGLAGLLYGEEGIPRSWRTALRGREWWGPLLGEPA